MRLVIGVVVAIYIVFQVIKCLMEEVRDALRFRKR
jgi:hypothetical protein